MKAETWLLSGRGELRFPLVPAGGAAFWPAGAGLDLSPAELWEGGRWRGLDFELGPSVAQRRRQSRYKKET